MNRHITYRTDYFISILTALIMSVAGCFSASAFSADSYTSVSRLNSGKWVKISIEESGIHRLTPADLRKMGFNDPSKVRVFGYGGEPLPGQLTRETNIDDLPAVPALTTAEGLFFYATGPLTRELATSGRYRYSESPFSDKGYYFLTEDTDAQMPEITLTGTAGAESGATFFNEVLHYEKNLTSPGETGYLFVGEDFRTTQSRTFRFTLTDCVPGSTVWSQTSFIAKGTTHSYISHSVNGEDLPAMTSDRMDAVNSEYIHARESRSAKTFTAPADNIVNFGLNFKPGAGVTLAALNYITLNYDRQLKYSSTPLDFYLRGAGKISGAQDDMILWDVTNPLNVCEVRHSAGSFTPSFGGQRHYVAWSPKNTSFPTPKLAGTVTNQNIHGMETPDMVIFCHSDWMSQGERLAALHASSEDNLKVIVLEWNSVFNEFSSGVPDPGAFRKCLKMFYDRPGDRELRYGLFFGRSTYDNRRYLTSTHRNSMPSWQSTGGLSDNDSYCSDDFYAFLEDKSGVNMSNDYYSIAVGRLPARTLTEARGMVDKIIEYSTNVPSGAWKNNILLIADDQDNGAHLKQTETMVLKMMESSGRDMVYNKVYMDAYPKIGSGYPGARADMFRLIDEGTLWWNFIGHANTTSWTHENLLTYSDMNSLYNRRWPVVYAATCNFMRWDAAAVSAAEILFKNDAGGVIAVISATRPVYISENKYMSDAMGRHAFSRGDDGRFLTIGEALRRAKNDFLSANSNKLRYVFLGDPAMRMAVPDNRAVVTHINGVDVTSGDQPQIMAAQNAKIRGYITADGNAPLSDFNGTLSATLYDADVTTVSLGNGEEGTEEPFDEHGKRLYAGSSKINNGEFELSIAMPAEIADNYRTGTLSLYARETAGKREAIGVNRDFYVYGFDDNAQQDEIAPQIESFYLNHISFMDGDVVNASPMAIAHVSDNMSLNLSSAGIGHQMVMFLDRPEESYPDVSTYFTPSDDGSPSGVIAYPLSNLRDGDHTLTLRVWDTGGNFSEKTISFTVSTDVAPKVFEIYSDANPASVEANFYLTHNRPDAMVNVTLEIFDLAGRQVWTTTQAGRSDLFASFPIRWNLCDMAGRRVPRGIYIYRTRMTEADGTESNSVSRKIAVTGR